MSTSLVDRIYNAGERLIPGVTHGVAELVRHRTSYLFFRAVIALDPLPKTILDLGCGVGHGSATLAELPGATVVGVDVSADAITWAQRHYMRADVTYRVADAADVVNEPFDYIVARASLEHVPDGIRLAENAAWARRLIFDVPYDERPEANVHHQVVGITERDMPAGSEVFFQDLRGAIYDRRPRHVNVIACVASRDGMEAVAGRISFPFQPWTPPRRADRLRLRYEHLRLMPHLIRHRR